MSWKVRIEIRPTLLFPGQSTQTIEVTAPTALSALARAAVAALPVMGAEVTDLVREIRYARHPSSRPAPSKPPSGEAA
jgi:hypothetical protein